MNLEQLTCTFEQAKRLRELGVVEPSYFVWASIVDHAEIHVNPVFDGFDLEATAHLTHAYTSAELGEIISKKFKTLSQSIINTPFVNAYHGEGENMFPISVSETLTALCITKDGMNRFYHDTSEAQARAEFLIYLLETK